MHRQKQAKVHLVNAVLFHIRHRNAQVFANEIERGVADDGGNKDARLPRAILLGNFRRVGQHHCRGRGGLKNPQPTTAGRDGTGRRDFRPDRGV
jgi:hypothetical protein